VIKIAIDGVISCTLQATTYIKRALFVCSFDDKLHFSEFQSNLSSFWVTTNDDENESTALTAKVTMAKAGISQVNRDLSRRSVHW